MSTARSWFPLLYLVASTAVSCTQPSSSIATNEGDSDAGADLGDSETKTEPIELPTGEAACFKGGKIVVAEGTSAAVGTNLHLSLAGASGVAPEFTRIVWTVSGPGQPTFVPASFFPTPTLEVLAVGELRIAARGAVGDAGAAFESCPEYEVTVSGE